MEETARGLTEAASESVRFLFAPMEGITYAGFRTVHQEFFPGAGEYFTPFIAPDRQGSFKPKYLKELTDGIPSVPQLLVNSADAFNATARKLFELGFREVNLNTGCPSSTVYTKHKGAGMLRDLNRMDQILDQICEQAEQLGYRISIKTRMGDHSTAEFPEILNRINHYPISRLIVHARCRDDFYHGMPDVQGFFEAAGKSRCPLVYNGNIASVEDFHRLQARGSIHAVMIGRGAVTNPALFRELTGGSRLSAEELRVFLDRLTGLWLERGLSPAFTVERMKTLWKYMSALFPDEGKQIKTIMKAKSPDEYRSAVSVLLSRSNPSAP